MIYSAAKFSQDTGISKDLATRLLDLLYKKELTGEDLNSLIWRLRDWVTQNEMPKLLEKMEDTNLNAVIDQMIAERKMWRAPYDICCAETAEQFTAALARQTHPSSMRFVSAMEFGEKTVKAGDVVTIQIMRTGEWKHALYGEVKVTRETLQEVKQNFDENVRGIQLAVDENHEDNHAALGWHKELFFEEGNEDALFARVELTKAGADKVNDGSYKYYSPEIAFQWTNEETGETYVNLLIGGAFTNRPFFKDMKPLKMSESASADGQKIPASGLTLFLFSTPDPMKQFMELIAKLAASQKLSKEQKATLDAAFAEIPQAQKTAEIVGFYNDLAGRFSEEGTAPVVDPAAPVKTAEEIAAEEAAAAAAAAGVEGEGKEKAPNGETPAASTIQANEDTGLVAGMEFNDDGVAVITDPAAFTAAVKTMQATLSKARTDAKFAEVTGKVKAMSLSKANPKGVVTPLVFKEVVDMAMSLNDAQAEKFLGLIGKFRSIGGTVGSDQEAVIDPMDPGYNFTEADEKVRFYMEKMNQTKEKAIQSAKAYYAEQAAKKK